MTPAPSPDVAGLVEQAREWASVVREADAQWSQPLSTLLEEAATTLATLSAEIERLREALHEIDIEAANTIPPDGKDAAFAALFRIVQIINPFRVPRAALETKHD